jgi:hypothetical protein
MINAIIYIALFYAINRFIPGSRLDSDSWNPYVFIPVLSISVGLIEGTIAAISQRSISIIFLAPILHLILNVAAWFSCKIIPWTRQADGSPTENGFIIVVVIFSVILNSIFSALKENS